MLFFEYFALFFQCMKMKDKKKISNNSIIFRIIFQCKRAFRFIIFKSLKDLQTDFLLNVSQHKRNLCSVELAQLSLKIR